MRELTLCSCCYMSFSVWYAINSLWYTDNFTAKNCKFATPLLEGFYNAASPPKNLVFETLF